MMVMMQAGRLQGTRRGALHHAAQVLSQRLFNLRENAVVVTTCAVGTDGSSAAAANGGICSPQLGVLFRFIARRTCLRLRGLFDEGNQCVPAGSSVRIVIRVHTSKLSIRSRVLGFLVSRMPNNTTAAFRFIQLPLVAIATINITHTTTVAVIVNTAIITAALLLDSYNHLVTLHF